MKLTLGQLLRGTNIQASVRLSVWEDGEEVKVFCFRDLEHSARILDTAKKEKLLTAEAQYIFCPGDHYLHIEVQKPI